MRLTTLIQDLPVKKIQGNAEIEIRSITQNSKEVKPGSLFVCIPGFISDGHDYISEALARGARALIVEREVPLNSDIATILVPDSRRALVAANRYYDFPSRTGIIGITGTNGRQFCLYAESYLRGKPQESRTVDHRREYY